MSNAVRAIFFVEEVTDRASGAGIVKLRAAAKGPYGHWSKWTPAGTIEITSLNDAATDFYRERLGKDVAVTFTDPTEADLATGED